MRSRVSANHSSALLTWANDSDYNEWRPPQVMAIPASTRIYGVCGEWLKGGDISIDDTAMDRFICDFLAKERGILKKADRD